MYVGAIQGGGLKEGGDRKRGGQWALRKIDLQKEKVLEGR